LDKGEPDVQTTDRNARRDLLHRNLAGSDDCHPTDRSQLLGVLEGRSQNQLQAHGVSIEQAKARVIALSNAEAAQLAAQIDSLPAGGSAAGALIGAVLIVFLVLLLTDILGFTKVFPFTKPIK
jgi:hypothetical protein